MSPKTNFCFIDSGIRNLNEVHLDDTAEIANFHYNQIADLGENILPASLINLDLSSNQLTSLCGVRNLQNLQRLNLSANYLCDVSDFKYLSSLVYLDLSYNQLENLSDLRGAQGHPLTYLDVRGNRLASIDGLIQDLSDLKNLKDLIISDEPPSSADNPLCYHAVCLNSKQLTLNHVNAPLILSRMLKQVKCSRGIQAIGDHCSNALRLVSPKKVRHVMLQVGIGSQERRKLISQLDQVSSELQMERSLRRKSEQLHESLLKKTEKLEERSKQEQDLLCENLRLKEELAIEVRSRNLLEKRLQDISVSCRG
uniref:Myosin_tail_1 domain-containing protein n=1 Tax=Mesocestoides corti TaxID=53468 RepID=A0A5K3EN76_MESCO